IDFNYVPHDDEADRERNYVRIAETTSFSPNWGLGVSINHISDPNYLHDYGESLISTSTSLLQSSAYLNGHGGWWSASSGGGGWQLSDPTIAKIFSPYRRLPRVTFQAEHALLGGLDVGINSEYADFHKDDALTGQRLDVYPYLAYPIETAAYFLRPELGWRYTR